MSIAEPEKVVSKHDAAKVMVSPGEFHPLLGGEWISQLGDLLYAPSDVDLRRMLSAVRRKLGWPLAFTGAMFGVSRSCIMKWESGARVPSGPAAKLIVLFHSLWVGKTEKIRNAWDLATWGGSPCRDSVAQAYLLEQQIELGPTYVVPEDDVFVFVGIKKKEPDASPA